MIYKYATSINGVSGRLYLERPTLNTDAASKMLICDLDLKALMNMQQGEVLTFPNGETLTHVADAAPYENTVDINFIGSEYTFLTLTAADTGNELQTQYVNPDFTFSKVE